MSVIEEGPVRVAGAYAIERCANLSLFVLPYDF